MRREGENSKTCIVHATEKGCWEISVSRGFESRLPGLRYYAALHSSARVRAQSLSLAPHPSATSQPTLGAALQGKLKGGADSAPLTSDDAKEDG